MRTTFFVCIASFILHSAFCTLVAAPLPVDVLWQSDVGWGSVGSYWNADGQSFVSYIQGDTLTILRDGEPVQQAKLGRMLAIDHGDVYPNIAGIEFIVALDEGDTHVVKILDGNELSVLNSFTVADEREAGGRVSALKWIGGDERKLLAGWGETAMAGDRVTWYGGFDVYGGDDLQYICTFEIGEPRAFLQLGDELIVIGGTAGYTIDRHSGYQYVYFNPCIEVFDLPLREQRYIELPSVNEPIENMEVSSWPWGLLKSYACIEGDSVNTILLSYGREFDIRLCVTNDRDWQLTSQKSGVISIVPVRTHGGAGAIDYVLCGSLWPSGLDFLNPYSFELTPAEYTSPFSSNRFWGSDLDGDGRTELLGFQDGQLTCARPQPLGVEDDLSDLPSTFNLQLYPNPFNSSTTISFTVPDGQLSEPLHLAVYDLSGRMVADLSGFGKPPYAAGEHTVVWEAADVSPGVYLVQLQSATYSTTQKVVLLK